MTGTDTAQFPFTPEGNCAFIRHKLSEKYPAYAATLSWVDAHYRARPCVNGELVLSLDGALVLAAHATERIWN